MMALFILVMFFVFLKESPGITITVAVLAICGMYWQQVMSLLVFGAIGYGFLSGVLKSSNR